MQANTTTMHTAYRCTSLPHEIAAAAPYATGYGPSTDDERRAASDMAAAFDGCGAVMYQGGLTPAQEWALEYASWQA